MNIKKECQENKLTMIALNKFIEESAVAIGLCLEGSLVRICAQAEVNRSQVYERKGQIERALERMELPGPGRPANPIAATDPPANSQEWELREKVLLYRLEHPDAVVVHDSDHATYSNGFIRFILDLGDSWEGSPERFCHLVEIPYPTFRSWRKRDKQQPYMVLPRRSIPDLLPTASEDFRRIVQDYAAWQGSLRDFLGYEAVRMHLPPTQIRRVLTISGMVPVKCEKTPRYRGSTERLCPGAVLVTDGKDVEVVLTASGQVLIYNWQGIVDQATGCNTAVEVTDTECAKGVRHAFKESCTFLGRSPHALLHDNKPIYSDEKLHDAVEKTTRMIPATLRRPENKAILEGAFGKFEQEVGRIHLDDSSEEDLKKSAVAEILRAYTAGSDHAGRIEFDGKSRQEVLRRTCPDPDKERRFIECLHAAHSKPQYKDCLPTREVARELLDKGFVLFGIEGLDPQGKIREWLSVRFGPEAIRQGLAIFGTKRDKGLLRSNMAHRYLVKVIQNCQHEIDLRRQEELLREFAETEQNAWLQDLTPEYELLKAECDGSSPEKDFDFRVSENAIFGCLFLQRAFWENKLKALLKDRRDRIAAVCNHIRRLFEATWENRFQLISKLIAWEYRISG